MRQQMSVIAEVTCGVLVWAAAGAAAQTPTLAELAKKEEERRKAIAKPSKVITIEDAKKYLPPPSPPPPAPAASTAGSTAAPVDQTANPPQGANAQGKAAPAETPAAPDPLEEYRNKDEAWWRNRASAARSALEQQRFFLNALIGQTSALTHDLSNPDANIRSVALTQLRATQDEADRVSKEVD